MIGNEKTLQERIATLKEFFDELAPNLTEKQVSRLEEMRQDIEQREKIPDSEKLILDSPKFTSFAVGMKDDGTFFTDEDTKRNNELLYGKDEE